MSASGAGETAAVTAGAGGSVPTGNHFDKYGSENPVVRRLMARFQRTLDELVTRGAPGSVLDVGCGEGVLTARLASRLAPAPVVGIDVADPGLAAHWAARGAANLRFAPMRAESLAFPDGAFELVCALEVLEHVAEPDAVLAEMARVSAGWLLVSVPREPLWRALNLARGAYLGAQGNTPGHLQHFGARAIARAVARHGEVVAVRAPLPWTMLLARVG